MAQNKTNGKADDQEEELVMVGDGVDEEGEELDKESGKPGSDKKSQVDDESESPQDKRQGHSEYDYPDEDEDDGDSESGEQSNRSGDRKQERKTRKQRQREARERDHRELQFLRQRNEQLERRFSAVETRVVQNEANAIDQRLNQVRTQIQAADEVMKAAMKAQNGDDFVEAQKLRDQLVRQEGLLLNHKQQRANQHQQQQQQLDPDHVEQARQFMSENPWYKLGGTDKDSQRLGRIDDQVLKDGYDPATPAYWQELKRRAKKAIPHRFKNQDADDDGADDDEEDGDEQEEKETPQRRSKPKGGPKFRSGGREVTLKKGQVYVSRERREAMEEAGVWDDPVLRKQYLASYAKYDRENAGN